MEDRTCPECGATVPAGGNFCTVCGAAIEEPPEDRTEQLSTIVTDADGPPVLVVVKGENAGSRFALSAARVTIGRHPDSDIFLDDVTVSRRHAEVAHLDPAYEVTDVGSLNGTYVNGERIDRAVLRNGDQVQVGKFRFVVIGASDAGT